MSYDLAVWEGTPPPDDEAASAEFSRRYDSQNDEPASPAIRAFVEALLARHPDLTEVDDDRYCPWADGPLINNADADFIYFALVPSMADEVKPFITETARAQGLVAFDPQVEELLTPRA